MTIRETAQVIADRLVRDLPAEEVWLFGSQARSDAGPDSNLDLLAVVTASELPRHHRARRAHALISDIRYPKDIIVLTREEWERQENVVNSLPYSARNEGVLLRSE